MYERTEAGFREGHGSRFMTATEDKRRIKMKTTSIKLAALIAVALITVMAVGPFAAARTVRPPVTLAGMAGPWQATVIGEGKGCGFGSKLLNFTLNSSGQAPDATWSYNTVSCSSDTVTATFTITSLNSDGNGTAELTVGGNTLHFTIQVNPTSNMFNLVDLTDTGNYEEGSAIRQ
jgi:hypothetical protein